MFEEMPVFVASQGNILHYSAIQTYLEIKFYK